MRLIYLVKNIKNKNLEISKSEQMKSSGYKYILIHKENAVDNIYTRSINEISERLIYYGDFGSFTCVTIDRYIEELKKLLHPEN